MKALLTVLVAATMAQVADAGPVSPRAITPGAYVLDPARANVTSRMRWFGVSQHVVRFKRVSGGFTYDPDNARRTRITIHVDPRSMSGAETVSGRQMLQMLEPERYPRITFTSREVEFDGGRPELVGDLTMHGVTRPLALEITLNSADDVAAGASRRVAFSGQGRIRRSEFGMAALRNVVSDRVDLRFDVEFTRQ